MPERSAAFNPFPGLRAFEADEDYLFFGRERAVDELIRRLRTERFLAIVGSSGSGKSSLVRSGLIPALHGGLMAGAGSAWRVAVMRPGGDPLGNLAAALNQPDVLGPEEEELADINRQLLETTLRSSALGLAHAVRQASLPERDRVLVVVDQFEEIFRYRRRHDGGHSRHDAKAFLRILLGAALLDEPVPIYVALTMRSDFIGDCMEFPGLPRLMNEGLYLVPRLTRDELRQAIVGPVAVGRGEIAARLVRRLLNDFGDDPDQLPILQHALMRTWDHGRGAADTAQLDLDDYEAVGGMKEALSRHAEEAWAELTDERERQIAERLFKLLTDRTRDDRGVRRPCRLREICEVAEASVEEVVSVVDRFREPGRSLLMPPAGVELGPDSIIDISHESLMRLWGRLGEWARREAASARFYLRLTLAALHHEEGTAGLWREEELVLARTWEREARPTESWSRRYNDAWRPATAFLEESRTVRERWLASQRRKRTLRRSLAAGSVMLLLAALAGWQTLEVREERRLAAERETALRANRILAAAVNAPDPRVQALLLGELDEAVEPPGGVRAARAVAEGLGADEPQMLSVHQGIVIGAAFTAGGPRVVTAFADGSVSLWNAEVPAPPVVLRGHQGYVLAATFSPAGDRVATASQDGTTRLWRSDGSGEPIVLSGHTDWVTSAVFGPDGGRLATASQDGTVLVWNADGSSAPMVLSTPGGKPQTAAFDPAGTRVATGSGDGSVRIWRLDDPGEPLLLGRHAGAVPTIAFSHDGSRVVTASDDGTARVWPADGLGEPIVLRQRQEFLKSARFSHDDREILTASSDGAVRIWNADGSGDPILLGRGSSVEAAAFRPDDAAVLTASDDGTARLWRTRWPELLAYLRSVADGCLTAGQRVQYLEETAADADAASTACEQRRGG